MYHLYVSWAHCLPDIKQHFDITDMVDLRNTVQRLLKHGYAEYMVDTGIENNPKNFFVSRKIATVERLPNLVALGKKLPGPLTIHFINYIDPNTYQMTEEEVINIKQDFLIFEEFSKLFTKGEFTNITDKLKEITIAFK